MYKKKLLDLAVVVNQTDSINSVFEKMGLFSRKVQCPGLCLILGKNNVLLGIVTDGDLRRAFADKISFEESISRIMNKNPITLVDTTPKDMIIPLVSEKYLKNKNKSNLVKYLILKDIHGKVSNVIDLFDLMLSEGAKFKNVSVIGLGFVGLTLATTLANQGHQVIGIENNTKYVKRLNEFDLDIKEPGLQNLLKNTIYRKRFKIQNKIADNFSTIYIISVGTPINSKNKPNLKPIEKAVMSIAKVLKKNDHVMIRSTVPVGTTRQILIPILVNISKLAPGKDFFISFVPERVVEGDALRELRALPQIIGGFTNTCLNKASEFWSSITPTIVRTSSIEASELIKLANNTFRDVSFAFANEIAYVASKFNINAFDLINAANEGYPRNKIPLPSPGVGGYCLTKDPILFSSSVQSIEEEISLSKAGRFINKRAPKEIIKKIEKHIKSKNLKFSDLRILIVGIAFKGEPETNDIRGSVSIDVKNFLFEKVKKISGWDAVMNNEEIKNSGFNLVKNLDDGIIKSDIVMILNNHKSNVESSSYYKKSKFKLIFDGWGQLNSEEIESVDGLTYSTIGYIS